MAKSSRISGPGAAYHVPQDVVGRTGRLYPVLHRLEAQGHIVSRWRVADSGRKRKYYALRGHGRQVLEDQKQQWLVIHGTLAKLWGV